jgi:hypothetical protein
MTGDIDLLRADLDAVINRVASPQAVGPRKHPQPLVSGPVPRIEDEPRRLEYRRRPQILLVRPVARAGRGAAAAHDAGDRLEYPMLLVRALQPLSFGRRLFVDEAGKDLFVLSEEGVHFDYEVLDHREGRERLARDRFGHVLDQRLAGEPVLAVYLHSAGTAYPVCARPPEGQASVYGVLDLRQPVEQSFQGLHLHRIFLPPRAAVPFGIETFYLKRVSFHSVSVDLPTINHCMQKTYERCRAGR